MKKVNLYKGSAVVSVYEIEVPGYIKNGWSKQKPAITTEEVKKDG